jgi:hypothetical protein
VGLHFTGGVSSLNRESLRVCYPQPLHNMPPARRIVKLTSLTLEIGYHTLGTKTSSFLGGMGERCGRVGWGRLRMCFDKELCLIFLN